MCGTVIFTIEVLTDFLHGCSIPTASCDLLHSLIWFEYTNILHGCSIPTAPCDLLVFLIWFEYIKTMFSNNGYYAPLTLIIIIVKYQAKLSIKKLFNVFLYRMFVHHLIIFIIFDTVICFIPTYCARDAHVLSNLFQTMCGQKHFRGIKIMVSSTADYLRDPRVYGRWCCWTVFCVDKWFHWYLAFLFFSLRTCEYTNLPKKIRTYWDRCNMPTGSSSVADQLLYHAFCLICDFHFIFYFLSIILPTCQTWRAVNLLICLFSTPDVCLHLGPDVICSTVLVSLYICEINDANDSRPLPVYSPVGGNFLVGW